MDIVGNMKGFLASIKAPWTFLVVLMATVVACYLVMNDGLGVGKAAFGFSSLLVGGYLSKALLALGIGAMRTMILMVFCALLLIVVNVQFTDSTVFKDAAVEGLLNFAGGSLIVLIGALLERHKT